MDINNLSSTDLNAILDRISNEEYRMPEADRITFRQNLSPDYRILGKQALALNKICKDLGRPLNFQSYNTNCRNFEGLDLNDIPQNFKGRFLNNYSVPKTYTEDTRTWIRIVYIEAQSTKAFPILDTVQPDMRLLSASLQTVPRQKVRVHVTDDKHCLSVYTTQLDGIFILKVLLLAGELLLPTTLEKPTWYTTWGDTLLRHMNTGILNATILDKLFLTTYLAIKGKTLDDIQNNQIEETLNMLMQGATARAQQEMENREYTYKQALADLEDKYTQLQKARYALLTPAINTTELMNMFKRDPNLKASKANEHTLRFTIKHPLLSFDTKAYAMQRRSGCLTERSLLEFYSFNDTGKALAKRIFKLCDAIFLENKFKVETVAYFDYNTNTKTLEPHRPQGYGDNEYMPECLLPHPHIIKFGCLGGFVADIKKALNIKNDLSFAVQIAIAASENINFLDNAVLKKFINVLVNRAYANRPEEKFLSVSDGTQYTIMEALNIIEGAETNATDNTIPERHS